MASNQTVLVVIELCVYISIGVLLCVVLHKDKEKNPTSKSHSGLQHHFKGGAALSFVAFLWIEVTGVIWLVVCGTGRCSSTHPIALLNAGLPFLVLGLPTSGSRDPTAAVLRAATCATIQQSIAVIIRPRLQHVRPLMRLECAIWLVVFAALVADFRKFRINKKWVVRRNYRAISGVLLLPSVALRIVLSLSPRSDFLISVLTFVFFSIPALCIIFSFPQVQRAQNSLEPSRREASLQDHAAVQPSHAELFGGPWRR